MADNKKLIKANIDAAIDPALGIGGILAVNHNAVLTETLFGAGKYTGNFFTASGALDGLAPTSTWLWNGEDPSQLTSFVIRLSKLDADLNDIGLYLGMLNTDELITFKDDVGRSFTLKFQSFVAGVDGGANDIYDVTVQGVATNSNYIYGPAETETAGVGFFTMGGAGGGIASVNSGQAITVDATIPSAPVVNLGGTIDDFVAVNITDPLDNGHGLEIEGTNGSGDNARFGISCEGLEVEAADAGGDNQSNITAFAFSAALNNSHEDGAFVNDGSLEVNQANLDARITYQSTRAGFPKTQISLSWDVLKIVTPAVDAGTATVGQVLALSNINGEVEFITASGGGNTIYSANDSLAGTRIVNLAGFQLSFDNAGQAVIMNNGRLGVSTEVFGGSRLGDSVLQAPSVDLQSINFKDTGQATALAMFFSPVGGGDGYVTTMKNFVDDVNVISIAGVGNAVFGGAGREVESTVGLRNDFTGGQFRVFDMFNNDYDSATPVAEAQGWVAIHGGGATKKLIGLWRYDGVTYDPLFQFLGAGDVFNVSKQTDIQGILRAFAGLRIQSGGNANVIQMEDSPNSSYTGATRNIAWFNAGKFTIQEGGVDGISAQFDISALTAIRQITVPDKNVTLGLDADAIHDNVAGEINALTLKATPVAGDMIVIEDSADSFNKKRAAFPVGGGGAPVKTAEVQDTGLTSGTGQINYLKYGDVATVTLRVNFGGVTPPVGSKTIYTMPAGFIPEIGGNNRRIIGHAQNAVYGGGVSTQRMEVLFGSAGQIDLQALDNNNTIFFFQWTYIVQ